MVTRNLLHRFTGAVALLDLHFVRRHSIAFALLSFAVISSATTYLLFCDSKLTDIGVYNGMVKRWGPNFHQKVLMSGGSAGTIFAMALALGKEPAYVDMLYSTVSINTLKRSPIYYGSYYLEEQLKLMLKDPLVYKKIEGRCCFGTTAFFSKHRWHVSWESNDDLLECLRASYHIPLYCKYSGGIKGVECVDGAYGFAGHDLPHGDQTLYVGIDPHAEITRSLTNNEMFYPTVGREYEAMVKSGEDAFMNWNGKMNIKVGSRQPNYAALCVLWTLKVIENIVYAAINSMYKLFFLLLAIVSIFASIVPIKK